MNTKNLILILLFALTLTNCATISYSPKVTLDTSPQTIKKTVKVENFIDKMDPKLKKKPFSGFSVTDSESLSNELFLEVTNAIVEDFNTNGVFSKISKREENPDFIIKGEILNFKGKYLPNSVFWWTIPIDIIWYFGIPVVKDDIDINIKLSIYKNSGELVGEYYGKSTHSKSYNIYKTAALGLPSRTNKYFSEAVNQIRKQIIENIDKFN